MSVWTGNGKVLIAWDMGCGPTWAYDPLGKPIKEKYLGSCEVWRSADGGVAASIGETWAEAFLDDQVENGSVVTYWIMEKMKTGGIRQVGPSIDVELPQARLYDDDTPPSPPNELKARRKAGGNELSWLASCDDESGVLAYFVYSANEHQPDAVLWLEDPLGRTPYGEDDGTEDYAPLGEVPFTAISQARYKWLDRDPNRKKAYTLAAIDGELNLSDQTGRVDPWTGQPPPSVWPAGTVPESYVGTVKERYPVEPVVPSGLVYSADIEEQSILLLDGGSMSVLAGHDGPWGNIVDGHQDPDGHVDGSFDVATFNWPMDVACDSTGSVYVADFFNLCVRKLDLDAGMVSTFAGLWSEHGFWSPLSDGANAANALFSGLRHIAIDAYDEFWTAETAFRLRRITGNDDDGWQVATAIGCDNYGNVDGWGVAPRIAVGDVSAATWDSSRSLYRRTITTLAAHHLQSADIIQFMDVSNKRYRQATTVVNSTNFYVWEDSGWTPGAGSSYGGSVYLWDTENEWEGPNRRQFSAIDWVNGMTIGGNHRLFFTQYGNVVRRASRTDFGLITIAGSYMESGSDDGDADAARFNGPAGIACDPETGDLYVADSGNHTIRKIVDEYTVTTVLGVAGDPGDSDGILSSARLRSPSSLAWCLGDLYIGESGYDEDFNPWGRVRVWDGSTLVTLVGSATPAPFSEGDGADAHLTSVDGLAAAP